jgi:hypothetical protein
MPSTRRTVLLSMSLLVTGCAGYRQGWRSVAYVGDAPPSLPADRGSAAPSELVLPGMRLSIEIGNREQSSDVAFILLPVPVSLDPRTQRLGDVMPGRTRVYLAITAESARWQFHPTRASLVVGSQNVSGVSGQTFGQWNDAGERVAQGGRWAHLPIADGFSFGPGDGRISLSIDFPIEAPSAQRDDIALDLARALVAPGLPPLPRVRFAPQRWREGYT